MVHEVHSGAKNYKKILENPLVNHVPHSHDPAIPFVVVSLELHFSIFHW